MNLSAVLLTLLIFKGRIKSTSDSFNVGNLSSLGRLKAGKRLSRAGAALCCSVLLCAALCWQLCQLRKGFGGNWIKITSQNIMRHVGSCEIGCINDRISPATDHLICCADEIRSAASRAVDLQEEHLIAIN